MISGEAQSESALRFGEIYREYQRRLRALEALGRSLCSLDSVAEVRFLVDGAFSPFYGAVDVSVAYTD